MTRELRAFLDALARIHRPSGLDHDASKLCWAINQARYHLKVDKDNWK